MPASPRAKLESVTAEVVLVELRKRGSAKARDGLARFGIPDARAFGVDTPTVKALARKLGRNHALAEALWRTGFLEARSVAALIGEPAKVTPAQMETWAKDFDNWATVDGVCCYLYCRTAHAYAKAAAWAKRKPEFIKRAAFSLMAYLAVHDKKAADERFLAFLPIIERESDDARNFVKKAVNWALRQIGKRNLTLHRAAIAAAERIRDRESRAARWIAADALREFRNPKIKARLVSRAGRRT